MGAQTYFTAVVPEPYTILGLRLKPFSLGHYYLMRRHGCKYANESATGGENPLESIQEFLFALVICSMSFEEFEVAYEFDRLTVIERRFKYFGAYVEKTVSFKNWLREWGKQLKRGAKSIEIFDKLTLFNKYLTEGMRVPAFFNEDESTRESGTHWSQSLLLVLTGELGYTQSEALNMPLSKALADRCHFLEAKGVITIMSDDQLDAFAGRIGGE